MRRIGKLNQGPITNESLRAIYREIMSSALSLEKSMTIAYLGPEATFTHQAAVQRFGSSLRYSPQKTIADIFTEVSRNRADYGVVPVENSTEGVVTHTLDMFMDSPLQIVAQIILPIQFCLAGEAKLNDVRRLYAHPQALAQCRLWVQRNLPKAEIIETSSNARSAELAAQLASDEDEDSDLHGKVAAITGLLAAEKYRLSPHRPGHPGLHRQRHALSGAGPPMRPAHGARPHQRHVQHCRQSGRALSVPWPPSAVTN